MGLIGTVFANGPRDRGLISKTQKVLLDIALLNAHICKVCIKGKIELFR